MLEALGLLEQAIAIRPRYSPALSWAAPLPHWQRVARDGSPGAGGGARQAIELARRALETTRNDDPGVLANASFILTNFGEEIGAMTALIDRALSLDQLARGWNISALLHRYGDPRSHGCRGRAPGLPCA